MILNTILLCVCVGFMIGYFAFAVFCVLMIRDAYGEIGALTRDLTELDTRLQKLEKTDGRET